MLRCRYEPRFDGEALGPDKHFPNSPCVAGAWRQFELITLADKSMFAQEKSLLNRPCIDRDNDVKRESNGTAPNCKTQVNNCQSAEIGEVVRTYCAKTCGICTPGILPSRWGTTELSWFCMLWHQWLQPALYILQIMAVMPRQHLRMPKSTKILTFRT